MSKPDAERTLTIYRTFVKQTENVVKYLSVARNYEHVTRLEIPTLKHAPTVLTNQLEEYVKDTDFEVMRRQYLAQQLVKKGGKATNGSNKLFEATATSTTKPEPFPEPKQAAKPATKGPAPDLIDFFESIEQNQTQMNTNPFQQPQFTQQNVPPQPTGFNPQAAFGAQQTGMLGQQAGFAPQATGMPNQQMPFGVQATGMPNQQMPFGLQTTGMPAQQQNFSPVQTQPTGNPFAQAQNPPNIQNLQPNFTGAGFGGYTPQPQNQNRFTPGLSSIPQNSASSFQPSTQPSFATGSDSSASTNPFRQSMLPPDATGTTVSSFGSAASTAPTTLSPQSTNPFAKPQMPTTYQNTSTPPTTSNSPFSAPPSNQFSNLSLNAQQQPLLPAATGTNPFAPRPQTSGSPTPFSPTSGGGGGAGGGITTHVTGSTNPFRQSHFVNQNTGAGWQSGPQGTIGGMHPEQIQTTGVFPRPGGGGVQQQPQPTGWPPQQQ
jgi:hypothetical protein